MTKKPIIWTIFNKKLSIQLPFLFFTCFAFLLCLNLAHWQWQRGQQAHQKYQAFQTQKALPATGFTTSPRPYQHMSLSGHVIDYLFLDNRIHQGQVGWHVLAVIEIAHNYLLVNLGWQPKNSSLTTLAPLPQQLTLSGIVKTPTVGIVLTEPQQDPLWPKVMQQIDIDDLNQQYNYPLLPFVLYAEKSITPYIAAPLYVANKFPKHLGYAIQWLLIALAAVATFFYISRVEFKENDKKKLATD